MDFSASCHQQRVWWLHHLATASVRPRKLLLFCLHWCEITREGGVSLLHASHYAVSLAQPESPSGQLLQMSSLLCCVVLMQLRPPCYALSCMCIRYLDDGCHLALQAIIALVKSKLDTAGDDWGGVNRVRD